MAATRRWAAAVGVVLALLTVAGPASAKSTAQARNVTPQTVGVAKWQVVIVEGTTPATAPAAPTPFNVTLLTPAYLTLTNIGTVTPGTLTVAGGTGFNLLGGLEICRVRWVLGLCSDPVPLNGGVFVAGTATPPPAPTRSWYLKVSGLIVTGVTLSALTTAPAPKRLNS